MKKCRSALAFIALVVAGAFFANGAMVDEEVACTAATGFLSKSTVAKTILAGREVASIEALGNLWLVRLAPSGYIEVAGSTKCSPILSFSENDFAEPEVGSPFAAKLSSDTLMVEAKEAEEDAADNADWEKYTAPVAKKRTLAAAKPAGTDGTGYTPFVAPLLGATWNQTAPFNDLSPYNYFCGCMATAAGQELRYWRWPYRYEKFRQTTHGVRDAQFNYSDFVLRPNGLVPFNWDKVVASAPNPASTPWAADKEATYNTAWLSLWAQSLTGMGYKPGGSGGTRQLASSAEEYWYEKGTGMTYWNDGYDNLWAAIKADLDWGSPIQINTAAHQMVIDGYAVENYGEEDEIDWINLNLGYGNATYWDNLKTAVTEGTYSGTLASFQTGFRPQKIVQFEPVPKVSDTSLDLAWHLPPCYTNKIAGFLLQTSKNGNIVGGGVVASLGDTTERYTYKVTDLEMGGEYTFTVTPMMSDASEARANSVTTTIGEPKAAPEFLNVSSVACGIELLQQDIFIECAYGSVNKIDLTCSESTTEVVPYSSHLTILPDEKLSVAKSGNVFTVNVDATAMDPKWSGEMLVLTLVAKNADGTEAYKNLMLRFNSMRQVINGTFDAADGDSNSAVWFCGDTTIDAKGRAVSFGASAFQGTGKVTLTDSIGGGSFTFASLDNFKGTLVFSGDVDVTLPSDMAKFEGALNITSGTYTLSNDLPASASVAIANGVTLNLDNANVASTITGAGTISITSGSSVLSGAVTSGVTLSGGDLTIPAGTGDYSNVSVGGGTLKIQLSQAQSILGYDWWLPLYTSGSVKFVLYDGTEVDAATESATPGIKIAHASDANVWTGTDYATFGETYSAKWSNGLPNEGDYVIFKSELNDWMETGTDEGTMMALNLTSPRNLGYVLVKGTDKLEIGVYSGATSALLSTDVLENEVETHITTTYFQPKAVIPHKKLSTSSGFILSCELDSAYADNLKKHETGGSALTDANYWQGTVLFCNRNVNNLELTNYGNAQSKIRFNGVTGSLMGGKTFDGTLELVDYDGAPAFNLSSGSSSYGVAIGSVTGTGMFKTSGSVSALNILLKDISDWTGSFDLASKTVAIGSSIPSSYTGNDGRLHICQAATVVDGATWKADGGLYLGAGGALTVNGAVEAKNVTTYGEGASITLEDGAVLQVSAASASDSVPTLSFKAGTFRVKEGADAFRETATINFCAGSGKRTVIDANGCTLTLGPNVFSGSGDVYLTSSKSGGKIVVEGIPAAYTGTIYCDISCEVSLGDLSKATNCNIDVADIILSRSSGDIGNLTIGLGATLEVTVTKDNQINGCTIDSVTLNNGATMVLKDKAGQVLETFTAEDAVDGKYILAADSSISVEYLLDYEFNGNMTSVGTDTTGLSIWNGTASYDSASQKIYMRCKPYINKTFAMPDDEWTVFMRCTLPVADSSAPTMMLMFGKNGGSVFGLVAGTGENTVALASKDGLIGEAVQVSDATTKQHLYTIVKTENRVRLYVDGVLKVDESATVSVSKEFQIGSVKNGNNTSYQPCDDANALIDFLKFYDFAVGQELIDAEVVPDDDPDPVVDPDATPLEESEGFVTSEYQLAFKNATLSQLTAETLGGKFSGGWVTNKGKDATFCNFVNGGSTMTCEAQIDGEYSESTPIIKAICLEFAQEDDDIYVKATEVKWKANSTLGQALTPVYNPGTLATTADADGYAFYNLTLARSEESDYSGPAPIAVWVAGEFGDDRSAHGGLEFALNGNTTNALGQIVIGSDTTLGATVAVPTGTLPRMTMLVKYSVPAGGAPVAQSVPASLFSTYDMGALAGAGSSALAGYWLNGSTVSTGSYAFSDPAQTMPQEGYILISNWTTTPNSGDHGTAVYSGETLSELVGGEVTGLRFTGADKSITAIGVGGPTVAGAKPWAGMVVESVALFDEWVATNVIANYKFPAQGAVQPEDSDYSGPAPIAVWVAGEFDDDRSAHGGCEFALNGNTTNAVGEIVIGNSTTLGATIAVPDYDNVTMLVKYEIPSGGAPAANSVPASVFVTKEMGALAGSGSSALEGYWLNGSNVTAGYAFSSTAPSIPQEGYLLISVPANSNQNPDNHYTAAYVGETVSALSGGETSGLRFTGDNNRVTSIGVGGPTVAGAVPWAGMVIKGVALFDSWLTPDDIKGYQFPEQGAVQPEDSDRYVVEPVASWVNDFKTTEKNGCTLSVSGTTAAKDDAFGGTLTIGDSAAVIDTASADALTVLVKYRSAPAIHSAPVVTFGGQAAVTFDSGICTDTSADRQLVAYYSFIYNNNRMRGMYAVDGNPTLSSDGGYLVCARKYNACLAYVGDSLDNMTGGECTTGMQISNSTLRKIGIGGQTELSNNDANMVPFTGFVVEKVVVFNGYYTPDQIRYIPIPEDGDTVNIADNTTWKFAATDTPREYTNIGTLSSSGTIAITNAAELTEGTYPLATWTTAQKKSTGYGHVGTLDTTGLPAGLSAELVYGAKAIYLRVWNPTTQAAKGTIKVWPYGDSITEGFNAGGTRANYRVLLAQKLTMLGYNVEMVGCYDKINNAEGIDPSGQAIPDAWKWHSAKHGATAGPTTSAAGRANLCENVDTLCAQAGNPDVVLLLAGANDIVPATGRSAQQVVSSITNIVAHIAMNLPDTKIVVGNQINVEQGYNSGNYNHVVSMIPQVNALLKDYTDALPEELVGKVFLADLNSYVKSGEYGILFDHGSDHLHPDWWGHDQMAEGWLSVVTNQFTATQTFPSATIPTAPTAEELGAAAKTELDAYRQGFKLARRIDAGSNLDTTNPYAYSGDGATEDIEKVGYFVEYVRADNNAHKWVWVDMDAFGTTIGDVGLPTANHQQVVTKLHVKSNHNGIDEVAANDDSVSGFIEFSPFDYNGNVSGVSGAPAGNGSCCDWNDTLSESGSYSCMQVHRVFSPAKAAPDGITRGGQVLFAYNNWQSSSSAAEFGIGNFSSHFYRGANDAQTLDYTYTANASKMNASAYSVKRIEIWTKAVGGDEPEEKTTSTTDFPVPYSWIEAYVPGIAGYPDAMYETVAKSAGANGYSYWESYVLGLDPTNALSKFTATIRMEGQKPVIEYFPTNEVLKASGAIEYILQGKPALSNDWQDVEFDEPGDTNRFFRVKVTW